MKCVESVPYSGAAANAIPTVLNCTSSETPEIDLKPPALRGNDQELGFTWTNVVQDATRNATESAPPSALAEIVVVPVPTAVTVPAAETVATLVLELP